MTRGVVPGTCLESGDGICIGASAACGEVEFVAIVSEPAAKRKPVPMKQSRTINKGGVNRISQILVVEIVLESQLFILKHFEPLLATALCKAAFKHFSNTENSFTGFQDGRVARNDGCEVFSHWNRKRKIPSRNLPMMSSGRN